MRPRIFAVSLDSRQSGALGDRNSRRHILPTHVRAEGVTDSKDGKCLGVVGIDGDSLLKQFLSLEIVFAGHAPIMRQGPHDQTPGIEVLRSVTPRAKVLGSVDLRLNSRNDGFSDLVLHVEDTSQLAIVALRPKLITDRGVIELCRDAHAIATLADAAFDQIVDPEFLADPFRVYRLAFVDEGGIASDDEEPAYFGQCRYDVLADAVRKIVLLRLAAHVDEGKYRDSGPALSNRGSARLGRRRRFALKRFCRHFPDEAHAPTRYGADQPLLVSIVADRPTRGIHATRQSRVGHDSATPDRGDKIVFGDDAVTVLHEIHEQVKHLRLDCNQS